ncbi:MAG: polymerase sigma factor, sigma-70 family [Pedosphaera sp.]|nr:polymerase sigma factor, sigma-70 family [Pedosphaera sp.]
MVYILRLRRNFSKRRNVIFLLINLRPARYYYGSTCWNDAGNLIVDANNLTKADWVHAALRQYEGPLTRYAAQITGDIDRARDVVQDTFVRLCAKEPEHLEGHLAEWLFTVCRNRALDVQRKESRMTPLNEIELEAHESREPSPSVAAERSESASQVLRMVATLPANQQEVIRLKFQNGLSYLEISRITNLTVTNVGFLIHTGIKALRQQLRVETKSNPTI